MLYIIIIYDALSLIGKELAAAIQTELYPSSRFDLVNMEFLITDFSQTAILTRILFSALRSVFSGCHDDYLLTQNFFHSQRSIRILDIF